MSKFTGKEVCVYSEFHNFNRFDSIEEMLSKTVVYQSDSYYDKTELHWTCEKDIVPYYAHMIGMGGYSNERITLFITKRPYFDIEEEEHLSWRFKDAKKYIMSCKRNKKIPSLQGFLNTQCFWKNDPTEKELLEEIYNRVLEHPYAKKFNMQGIHLPMQEYYRNLLHKEMLEYGYTEEQITNWIRDGNKTW